MAEKLSFVYQQRYLAKKTFKNDNLARDYKKVLAKKFNIPAEKITFHSAF